MTSLGSCLNHNETAEVLTVNPEGKDEWHYLITIMKLLEFLGYKNVVLIFDVNQSGSAGI